MIKITAIRTKDVELAPEMDDFINLKIGTLDKFYDKIIDAYVELEKMTKHHKTGPFYRAIVDIRCPGKVIRAESQKEDLKVAINWVKDELQTRLKAYKESQKTLAKRGGRVGKKLTVLAAEARLAAEEGGGGRTVEEGR